ncbi:discoidin domain-containing protein [Lysinibacillus sp. NPDC093692]|uniref:discoidin domain-containing protein n=1 Tax=Lysinibacillus sp. NPDC093692 TaxID=3390578 RepID=UPI003D029DD6
MTTELKNLIPIMTSDTTPSGQSFGDSLLESLYNYWYAFNNVDSQSWTSKNTAFPHYIGYEFTHKTKITQYTIRSRNFDNNDLTAMAKSWEFQGSDDNSNWVTIDTRTNIVWTSKAQDMDFLLGRAVEYKYYRLKVIANNGYAQTLCTIGQLKLFYDSLIFNKITIKNPTKNEYYSLADNTLIHMPNNSPKNLILHGIEQGKEIQLNVPFDKHRYFNDTPVANVSGKVFTHSIDKVNTLNIKEFRANTDIQNVWFNINMTSNNAPAPLVASASSYLSDIKGMIWQTFNNDTSTDSYWMTPTNTTNGWIQIDFGEEKLTNVISIRSRDSTITASPKSFEILGSNNNSTFEKIAEFKNEVGWLPSEERIYRFDNTEKFRYLRLNVLENNGYVVLVIARLRFGHI